MPRGKIYKNKHCKVLVSCSVERFKKNLNLQKPPGTFRNIRDVSEPSGTFAEPENSLHLRNLKQPVKS